MYGYSMQSISKILQVNSTCRQCAYSVGWRIAKSPPVAHAYLKHRFGVFIDLPCYMPDLNG